jgi:hypothetical protein
MRKWKIAFTTVLLLTCLYGMLLPRVKKKRVRHRVRIAEKNPLYRL